MGLFGYGRKDFERNGVRMQTEIAALKEQIAKLGEGKGIDKALAVSERMLLEVEYPKGANGKELEAIDARIFALLKKIGDDLQNKKFELASTHAKMLHDAIAKSRKFGRECFSEEQLRTEEVLAETRERLRELLREREKLFARMKEIEHEADRLEENDPRFEALEKEYNGLETKREEIDRDMEFCIARYNSNVKLFNQYVRRVAYEELPANLKSERDLTYPREITWQPLY